MEALSDKKNVQMDFQQQLVVERLKGNNKDNQYENVEKQSDEINSNHENQMVSLCISESNPKNAHSHSKKRPSMVGSQNPSSEKLKNGKINQAIKYDSQHSIELQANFNEEQKEKAIGNDQRKSFSNMLRQSSSTFQLGWNEIKINQKTSKQNRLKEELENITQNTKYRQIKEKFIILFNENPAQSFQYLKSTQLFDFQTEEEEIQQIAIILLNTEGLSKQSVGKFFGKDIEFNLKVLEQYC